MTEHQTYEEVRQEQLIGEEARKLEDIAYNITLNMHLQNMGPREWYVVGVLVTAHALTHLSPDRHDEMIDSIPEKLRETLVALSR